jgi:WD40 repeat protein
LAVSHDRDRTLFVWDLADNQCFKEVTLDELAASVPGIPRDEHIASTRFFSDSRRIAVCMRSRAIVIYDIETGACLEWLLSDNEFKRYSPPQFQPGGDLAAFVYDGVWLFDTNNFDLLENDGHPITSVTWGHDGTYFIKDHPRGDFVVRQTTVWENAYQFKDLHQFVGSSEAQPAISPDGRTFATTEGSEIVLWNFPSGRQLLRIPLSVAYPHSLRFSDQGRRLTAEYEAHLPWQAIWQLDASVNLID